MKQGTFKNLFVGLSLGIIAAFLGIGGGPINMGAILLLFGLSIKAAANMSILIIFFSQLTNIGTIASNGGFIDNNMEMLPVVLVAGISAGLVGRYISLRTSEKKVEILFDLVLIVIMVINIMNLF